MSGIIQGFRDLIGSVLEIVNGIFDTVYAAMHSVLSLVAGLLGNFVDAFEDLISFLLGRCISVSGRVDRIALNNMLTILRKYLRHRYHRCYVFRIRILPGKAGQSYFCREQEVAVKMKI
jgi:hypothetical protein